MSWQSTRPSAPTPDLARLTYDSIVYHLLAADSPVLLPARWQMTVSLGTHIILSCFGVAFPAMIWVVHGRAIRNDDPVALGLAKRWSKVAAVLFAVGAVSGTILSFEMGLLWPEFMRQFGDVMGVPFALEGIAFFLEAIFLGIYLYGWGRMPPKQHRAVLIPIALSGVAGTFCILAVNSWMNSPTGFQIVDGKVTDINPWAAMFNDAVWLQFLHMWIATFMVVGFCVAAVYATGMLRGRDDRHHRMGFAVPYAFAAIAALAQPAVGHLAGLRLATAQPSKLAAIELSIDSEDACPLDHRWCDRRRRGEIRHRDPAAGLVDLARATRTRQCRVCLIFPMMNGRTTAWPPWSTGRSRAWWGAALHSPRRASGSGGVVAGVPTRWRRGSSCGSPSRVGHCRSWPSSWDG